MQCKKRPARRHCIIICRVEKFLSISRGKLVVDVIVVVAVAVVTVRVRSKSLAAIILFYSLIFSLHLQTLSLKPEDKFHLQFDWQVSLFVAVATASWLLKTAETLPKGEKSCANVDMGIAMDEFECPIGTQMNSSGSGPPLPGRLMPKTFVALLQRPLPPLTIKLLLPRFVVFVVEFSCSYYYHCEHASCRPVGWSRRTSESNSGSSLLGAVFAQVSLSPFSSH